MASNGDGKQALMTVKELADYLRVDDSTIYRLLKRKRLPGIRVASDWRFAPDVIDRWIKKQEKENAPNG